MKIKKILLICAVLVASFFMIVYLSSKFSSKIKQVKGQENAGNIVTLGTEEKKEALKVGVSVKKMPVVINNEDSNLLEELIKNLESPDLPTAQKAAEELVKLGKVAVPGLIEALKSASVGLKGQIIFLLGRMGDKEAVPALLETLKDENAYIRSNSAEALGKIKDTEALSSLTTSLFDDDFLVRERSARALGQLNNSQATEDLINRMADEKDERVKLAVIDSFAKLKDQRVTQVLLNQLQSQSNQLYKNEVVFSLGEIGDPVALESLTNYLAALMKLKLTEPIAQFQWEQAVKIAQEAIQKIEKRQ